MYGRKSGWYIVRICIYDDETAGLKFKNYAKLPRAADAAAVVAVI